MPTVVESYVAVNKKAMESACRPRRLFLGRDVGKREDENWLKKFRPKKGRALEELLQGLRGMRKNLYPNPP